MILESMGPLLLDCLLHVSHLWDGDTDNLHIFYETNEAGSMPELSFSVKDNGKAVSSENY